MPFETQKKNSAVDKSSSIKENDKNEIDLVSKKVIKTKQEIENLKLELQKLINTGLCSENENLTKTDVKQVEKLSCNGQEPPPNNTHCDINKRNHEKYATVGRENILLKYNKSANLPKIHQVSSNITTRFNYVSLKKYKASNNENNKIDCQKKKNEYNKEKAREYIKKQREKRAEQMKVKIKETQNEIDLRKKKLKELHEKSLQLVSKSVKQKRRKSQSYEKKVTASENKQPSTCQNKLICNLLPRVPNICELEEPKHNFNKEDREVSVDQFGYISKRKENEVTQLNSHLESHCKTDTGLLESNVKRDELLCNAATKIQAYFRGFRQRKLYRNILTIQQNENLKEENVIQSNENNLEKSKLTWLDVPATLPYPYNFINAVKKKLSHAVNKKVNERMDFSEFSKSNVLSDHFATKRNTENLTSKPAPIVENSQKHYELFNDEFNSINHVEVVPSIFKEIQLSESSITFWKNKDISFAQPFDLHVNFSQNSINRSNSSNSRCDLKSLVSNKCMDLDLQTIKPLSLKPLQIDSQYVNNNIKREYASDSDTSKNIPDISTESSVHTRICKQAHLLHSLDSSHKTDDYNLVCNPERHNNLRRSRRRKLTKSDETIQTLLSHADTDDKCLKHKKDEIVNELTANSTISKPCSSLPLSEGESKPLPLTNMIYKNDSSATNNAGETEDTGNTTMLSSFLSYMQCLGVETYTKPNTKNEVDSEKNENTTVSLLNSKCKETKLMNLNEDQFERFSEIDKRKYSSDFESLSADNLNFVPSLKCPSVTLNTSHLSLHNAKDQIAHLQVPLNQKFQPKTIDTKINSNEIHLKFEAEIRLLHHFNKSLQEAVEKEKSLLENHYVPNNKNGEDEVVKEKNSNNVVSSKTKSNARIGTINYSRGSDVLNSCEPIFTASTTSDMLEKSFFSNTNLSISSVTDINESDKSYNSNSTILNFNKHHKDHLYPGLPLGMFNQLIKDEDARIENLKTILKIREKSLLDRTKSELAWLEIQKRYLKDSGQLNEISMIKKKQRGLLVKLQHERHEMQRYIKVKTNAKSRFQRT
ncbi:uncharacterized protein LOC108741049 [Agrilus planipennis]|uniref:Uncharacterized protein LOC108741049 n=1 Tax=Agrilus planipennis TaxID=224129 RepID=A0A1W4XEG4_AGRPL|nr:uncharacterized protein LOC108741049 [Agrilus planipennis]